MRAHRVKFPDELIDVGRNRHLARHNVLIHASLALLPFLRPEPSLVGGHRDLGTQLNHSVVTLHDFDLRTGTIKMVSSSKIGWKYDFAPSSNTNERSLSHEPTIAELP